MKIGELLLETTLLLWAVSTHPSFLHPARKMCLNRGQSSHTSMFATPQGLGRHVPLMPVQRKSTPKLICVSVTQKQSKLCSKRKNSDLLCNSTSITKGSAFSWGSQKITSDINIKGTPFLIVMSTFLAAERDMKNCWGKNIPELIS